MSSKSNRRIGLIAVAVVLLDQISKLIVDHSLPLWHEKVIIDGFFKFVHWDNTGAAWSMFTGRNALLAAVAVTALVVLYWNRHHFDAHTLTGQISLGLIFGGITGNLIDRVFKQHVVDFIYFYLQQRDGGVKGFPAFNVADSAICIGVGLLFIYAWRKEQQPAKPADSSSAA